MCKRKGGIVNDFILEIVRTIAPLAFALITLFLTNLHNDKVKLKDTLRIRLDEFYIPFFNAVNRGMLGIIKPSQFDTKTLCTFLDLLILPMHNASQEAQVEILKTYREMLDMFEYANGNKKFINQPIPQRFDKQFYKLYNLLFKEYSDICHTLKLPKPANILDIHF
ncbi:hypothetical protein MKC73_19020 [[Clostridium] innocuum]|nr:hypothetical protein [[Clostridium] innocuum]